MRQAGMSALLRAITLMLMTSAAAASSCTWYTSPSGSDSNSGKAPGSPVSLKQAVRKTQPGDVVCLRAGTYYVDTPFQIYHPGTAAKWITYTNYSGEAAVFAPNSGSAALLLMGSAVQY